MPRESETTGIVTNDSGNVTVNVDFILQDDMYGSVPVEVGRGKKKIKNRLLMLWNIMTQNMV